MSPYHWLFLSFILIYYSSITTISSAANCVCNEAFPTIQYNGKCYATIGGADPNDETLNGCEESNKWYTLPEGWTIAEGGSDSTHVTNSYPWSTLVLTFGYPSRSGIKFETYAATTLYQREDVCASCYVQYQQAVNQYKTTACNLRVLISKPAECGCDDTTDYNLLFIVDESASVTQINYALSIDFIINLIESDINDIAKLAVLSYSSFNDVVYKFENTQNDNRKSIINVLNVEKLDYANSVTQTLNALENGLQQFKDNKNIGNSDNNLIILFTDGRPTVAVCPGDNNNDLLQELNGYNIRIIIVGITSLFDKQQLSCIAKSGDIFKITDFTSEAFQEIESELKNILCPRPACPVSSASAVSHINDNNFDYDQIMDGDNNYNHKFYKNMDPEYMAGLLFGFCMGIISMCCIGLSILICSKKSKSKGYVEPEFQDDIE